jgi:UDP-N-acetylmuramate dehydrogenase
MDIQKINQLKDWLTKSGINFSEDFDLSLKSWIKAGGIIKNFITPNNLDQIIKLLKYLNESNLDFYILGNLSNTLIRDGLILTPIINLSKFNKIEKINDYENKFSMEAGVSLTRFSNYLVKQNISGTEGLIGIPGSIGGGLFMNASSYGSCISDFLINVTVLDKIGNIKKLSKAELNFAWRSSYFQNKKLLIIKAEFKFNDNKNNNEILKNKERIIKHRYTFQEKKYPNLGSIFATKNIYKDLSKKSYLYFLLYVLHKCLSIIFSKISTMSLIEYRKFIVLIYSKLLKIDRSDNFFFSDRTLNCLVNLGSKNANKAIKLVKYFEKKMNYSVKLENIILDKIK